jgi:trans-feruloyl-CoA hydratase/vanillin synthase
MPEDFKTFQAIKLEREGNGITWLYFNRPEKRNAMNPTMHLEMVEALDLLEFDADTRVLIITGAGESWNAGQDLREYFRALEDRPAEWRRANKASHEWRWRQLNFFPKPTIAMVNGYVFGGGFTPLIACDFAIAADEATFGLSEINWGTFPGGTVSRVLAEALNLRSAMYYIMTGEPMDGKKAAEIGLVTKSVPKAQLREETMKLANTLLQKNPKTLAAAKEVYKHVKGMEFGDAEDYMAAKSDQLRYRDPEKGRERGMQQFLDDKTYRPGLGNYNR